jgi:hypothetical protein
MYLPFRRWLDLQRLVDALFHDDWVRAWQLDDELQPGETA